MRKLLFLLVTGLIWNSVFSQSILNPNFELLDKNTLTNAKYWTSPIGQNVAGIDSTVAFEGKYSLRLTSIDNKKAGIFGQQISLDSIIPFRIKFGAYIKSEITDKSIAGIFIYVMNGKKIIQSDYFKSVIIADSNNWEYKSINLLVDQKATSLFIGGNLFGPGKVWYDKLTFEIITDPIISENASTYIDDFFHIIETKSLMKDSIDLIKLKKSTLLLASGAKITKDCYPALNFALGKLGDNHSHLVEPEDVKKWENSSYSEYKSKPYPTGQIINREHIYAYISIPDMESGNTKDLQLFADSLQNLIRKLDNRKIAGWILDLRNNTGGNCWPMLAGVGPLIENGVCGYFISAEKESPNKQWFYSEGKAGIGNLVYAQVTKPYTLRSKKSKIALLIGPNTMSSGELLAVSFIGKPQTRLFGEPTAGLTTANSGYKLSDGAMIWLATSIYADRNLKKYGGKISPDEIIQFTGKEFSFDIDPAINAAINWFKNGTSMSKK